MSYPSRTADRFIIRLPDGMRDSIREIAAQNRRSMNAEIVFQLEQIFGADSKTADEREARSAA